MQILLVEDDAITADFIQKGLVQAGFCVMHAADGLEGLSLARHESFDLAVIDRMLPKLDGLSLIRELRKDSSSLPIIVLSAHGAVEQKIQGLESGCDDYLAKPFSLAELIARINAQLRRSSAMPEPGCLQYEDLTLDILSRKVWRAGLRIDLQPLEFQLLEYMIRNRKRVVSKTTIMQHVWDYNFDTQTNVVESRMCHLREKIDKPFERKLLHTVRGFGYVLE